ncbi:MAG TPA: alpha-L-fucosidase [Arachidicoccus soli]|nr:alpha-L-fucosidase [Arachidicoccus soli]
MKDKSKFLICLLVTVFYVGVSFAQQLPQKERMEWWSDARFGMFIHFGVSAQWAGVYHGHEQRRGGAEWIMNRCKIPVAEYQSIAKDFNPVNYNPEDWVKMAKDAGMKYIVITAKHHDGFAMFKTAASKWNIVDATPYGKDILKPLADACHKYGIKLGFYYSQAQDWNNPGGSAARKVANEGWANPDSTAIDAYTLAHQGHWDPAQETATFEQYVDKVAVPQVKELLTNYGEVSVLWWDTPTGMTDDAAKKLTALLALQPKIITNDRLKRPNFPGDTKTPEQRIPDLSELDGKYWETCMTMNGSWGYRSKYTEWKSTETLIRNLVDIASKGGNYLLNVGPKPDGTFPEESIERLKEIGDWMKVNHEAIYATQENPLSSVDWGRITKKDDAKGNTTLYLSVFNWPKDGVITVPGLKNKVTKAMILANGVTLKTSLTPNGLAVNLPANAPDKIASVIKLTVVGNVSRNHQIKNTKSMKTGALD